MVVCEREIVCVFECVCVYIDLPLKFFISTLQYLHYFAQIVLVDISQTSALQYSSLTEKLAFENFFSMLQFFEQIVLVDDFQKHLYRHLTYGVATISRLLKIIGLFCRI